MELGEANATGNNESNGNNGFIGTCIGSRLNYERIEPSTLWHCQMIDIGSYVGARAP